MPETTIQPAAHPLVGLAAKGDLSTRLDELPPRPRSQLSDLMARCDPGETGSQWHQYITRPRALVYTGPTLNSSGDDLQAMRAMLVVPWEGLQAMADFTGRQAWRAAVTVLGVSAHRRATPADSGQPRLFAFEAARLPPALMRPTPDPRQVMSVPRLLPGWLPVRVQGASSRWQALMGALGFEGTTLAQYLLQCARAELHALLNLTRVESRVRGIAGEQELTELGHALLTIEADVIERCLNTFCSHLNPVVAQGCLHRRGALVPAEYNWVTAGQHARQWQWRMDALELFPALCTSAAPSALPVAVSPAMAKRSEALRLLKEWSDAGPTRGAQTVAKTVDDGLPLIRQLATAFKVKPATIRALRHVSADAAPVLERPPVGWPHLLRTLDRLPPERYPRSESQWNAFSILYLEGHAILDALNGVKTPSSHQWEEDVMQPWLARAARNWIVHLERHRDAFRGVASLAGAAEVTQCLGAWFTQMRVHPARRRKVVQALASMRVDGWQRLLNRWVGLADTPVPVIAARAVTPVVPTLADLPGVPALPLPVTLLNNAWLLHAEGSTMRHCIFTYWHQLPFKPYLIFALGTPGSPDRSTALLVYKRNLAGGWNVHTAEQRAFANGRASPASQSAAAALCELLSSPAGQPFLDAAELARTARMDALLEESLAQRLRRESTPQQQRQFARLQRLLEELDLWPSEYTLA
jgi:hypothetical protein